MKILSSLLKGLCSRRCIGIVILTVLLASIAAYVVGTDDGNVRAMAEGYLSEITGETVSIESASFSLFGPIKLRGVSITSTDKDDTSVITADLVSIRHNPWTLLWGGIEPTDILCVKPIVTIDQAAAIRKISEAMSKPSSCPPISLPAGIAIRIRGGLVRLAYRGASGTQSVSQLTINASAIPMSDSYRILFGPDGAGEFHGTVDIACQGAELRDIKAAATVDMIASMLPPELRKKVNEYALNGMLRVELESMGPNGPRIAIVVESLTGELPESIGQMRVYDMNGRIIVDPARGFWISEPITARITRFGKARLEVRGFLDGFDENARCRFTAAIRDFEPPKDPVGGEIGKILAIIDEMFKIGGLADLTASYTKEAGREGRFVSSVKLRKAEATFIGFPYRLKNLEGTIDWTLTRVENFYLTGTRMDGAGSVTIRGNVDVADYSEDGALEVFDDGALEVFVEAFNVPFDDELARALGALPEGVRKAWFIINSTGIGNAVARVRRPAKGAELDINVTVDLDGRAGMTFERFPYRLDRVEGKIRIMGDDVLVYTDGWHGNTKIGVDGWLVDLAGDDSRIEMEINVADLPIDKDFLTAVDARAKEAGDALRGLHAEGTVATARVVAVQDGDKPLDYTIDAELRDCSIKPDIFPYVARSVNGWLEITPKVLLLKKLRGQHGKTRAEVSGRIPLSKDGPSIDNITVNATLVELDEELKAALPLKVREAWPQMSPTGTMDIDAVFREGKGKDSPLDYEVIIKPVKTTITYKEFPLPLTFTAGQIVAVAGHVDLKKLHASCEGGTVDLDGRLGTDGQESTVLTLRASKLPVSKALIDAIRIVAPDLADRLKPDGTVGLEPLVLTIERAPAATTAPATAPATVATTATASSLPSTAASQPATAPAEPFRPWRAEGVFVFDDVPLDIGLSSKTITGQVSGAAWGPQLGVDAEMALASIQVGGRQITNLTGRLFKKPTSDLMMIQRFEAKAYGGTLDGQATIKLTDPMTYRADLRLVEVDLSKLVNAGGTDPKKRSDVKGLLGGYIWMQASLADALTREGEGRLRISEGRITKLPVMLELLHLVQLQLPGNTAFTSAEIQYRIKGNKVTFTEIFLDSDVLSLVGTGKLNVKTGDLRLTFLAGPVGRLPRVGQSPEVWVQRLTEIFRMVAQKLVVTEVTGNVAKPVTTTVPLPPLSKLGDFIRQVLHPEDEVLD